MAHRFVICVFRAAKRASEYYIILRYEMPSSAIDKFGKKVFAEIQAFQFNEKRPVFSCPECAKRMVSVNGEKYAKHFRHYRRSDCEYEREPETPEHSYVKKVVEAIFSHFSKNDANLLFDREYKISDSLVGITKYADVYCESKKAERRVVVEVQQANYDIAKFLDKILFYVFRGYTVVYLFIGSQFGKTIKNRETIYTLMVDVVRDEYRNAKSPGMARNRCLDSASGLCRMALFGILLRQVHGP